MRPDHHRPRSAGSHLGLGLGLGAVEPSKLAQGVYSDLLFKSLFRKPERDGFEGAGLKTERPGNKD